MKKKIYIDGKAGTVGLQIYERLSVREDLELITIPEELRKDTETRKKAMNEADVVFLCLPDAAAIEACELVENPDTVIIDASTAHRTNPDWAYGFPELSPEHESRIKNSKRIAVTGCHASGFIALVYPLVASGFISKGERLSCFSITGYSGGGNKMIAEYEGEGRNPLLDAPRQYGIAQKHKHLPEMKAVTGLDTAPIFCPIVADFYSGMEVTVPLFRESLKNGKTADDIKELYKASYCGGLVKYEEKLDENGFISAATLKGIDYMKVSVDGNDDRIILTACFDNLGKGASGAAVECMNIVLGLDKGTGLTI